MIQINQNILTSEYNRQGLDPQPEFTEPDIISKSHHILSRRTNDELDNNLELNMKKEKPTGNCLNDKFNNLLSKIEKKGADGLDGEEDPNQTQKENYNKDDALKALYEESVDFKNRLAKLRGSIKTLNA